MSDWVQLKERFASAFAARRERQPEIDAAIAAHHREARERTQGYEREILAQQLADMGAPDRAVSIALGEGLQDTPAVTAVRGFLASDAGGFLVLWGGVGCGKSLAAIWALTQGGKGFYLDAAALMFAPQWARETSERVDRAKHVPLLVLDELKEKARGDDGLWQQRVEELVDARWKRTASRTIVTTNLNPLLLRKEYGERVWDRIQERGGCFNCGAASLRKPMGVKP